MDIHVGGKLLALGGLQGWPPWEELTPGVGCAPTGTEGQEL